jgi:hypothetical protein
MMEIPALQATSPAYHASLTKCFHSDPIAAGRPEKSRSTLDKSGSDQHRERSAAISRPYRI